MGDRIRTIVVVVVTTVWTLNFFASILIPDYKAPPEINAIFMAIVGAAFVTTSGNTGNRPLARRNQQNQPQPPPAEEETTQGNQP